MKEGGGQSHGFTLIELMVVIVIIGIMATVSVPAIRLATYDRHAYDDAGAIMQLFRAARTRSIARGAAVLVSMTSNGRTDRGTFRMYESVTGGSNVELSAVPISACKSPTNWTNLPAPGTANATLPVRYIDGVNLNGPPETDADIETTITVSPSATGIAAEYVCFTPLGRAYAAPTNPIFTGLPNVSPIQVLVQRLGAGGNAIGGRSVLVLPNGTTRIYSHVGS